MTRTEKLSVISWFVLSFSWLISLLGVIFGVPMDRLTLIALFAALSVASLFAGLKGLVKWRNYRRYVGKTWTYRCLGGHKDGTTCAHDGDRCVVFPLTRPWDDYVQIVMESRNKTLFMAQFPDGDELIVHISSLKRP